MSLRALWILSPSRHEGTNLLFFKSFLTVEKRARLKEGGQYVPLLSSDQLASALLRGLGLSSQNQQVVKECDECQRQDQKPVFELSTSKGSLWPVMIIEQQGLIFGCLPFVEQGAHTRPPLIQIPGLSIGFSMLVALAEFLGSVPKSIEQTHSKLSDLHLLVGQAIPFGTPLDVNPLTVKATLQMKSGHTHLFSQKQPAWKPLQYKGRPHIQFSIQEQVRTVQYDRDDECPDVWEVHGTVLCQCDLEGATPDVTVSLTYPDGATPLHHASYHPFVQSSEHQGRLVGGGAGSVPCGGVCRIRFLPPLEQFALCHYTAVSVPSPPIRGFYQMKGEKTVELLCQIKLSPEIKNQFEYCELQMPFFHRGMIMNVESSPSHGSVLVSAEKDTLVWNIGQKFPSKTGEALLKATVYFSQYEEEQTMRAEHQFCVKQNAFAQLFFKINDFTHTGLSIDPKSVQVSPNTKFKLTTASSYTCGEYKIWNSHGDAPAAFQPPTFLIQQIHQDNSS